MKIVVVPGQNPNPKGKIPPEGIAKVKNACLQYKKSYYIIMSGKWSLTRKKPLKTTEAKLMKKIAIENGIPAKSIILEEKSMDTLGNAYFTKKILEKNNWNKIILIVSPHNHKRCKYIFSKILGPKYTIETKETPQKYKKGEEKKLKEKEEKKFIMIEKLLSYGTEELFKKYHPAYVKNSTLTLKDIMVK